MQRTTPKDPLANIHAAITNRTKMKHDLSKFSNTLCSVYELEKGSPKNDADCVKTPMSFLESYIYDLDPCEE